MARVAFIDVTDIFLTTNEDKFTLEFKSGVAVDVEE